MVKGNTLGSWAFILGLIVAVLVGLGLDVGYKHWMIVGLFLLGLVVGLLNVTAQETGAFLTAGTVLALLSYIGINVGVFTDVEMVLNILRAILVLFVPATMVVALTAVYQLARN